MKLKEMERKHQGNRAEAFGLFDSKGREIGGSVSMTRVVFAEAAEDERGYFYRNDSGYLVAGEMFKYCPHATRDGKYFGACQSERFFKTEAERNAAVDKYFAGARKRAAKIASK